MQDQITELDKEIYNTYLKYLRGGKPFKKRVDFDDFLNKSPENYIHLKKLTKLFETIPSINIDSFFEAPYFIYGKDTPFYLEFFTTPKALKCYKEYIKFLMDCEPDNPNQLMFIKNSIVFIKDFCRKNNLSINEYLTTKNGELYYWLVHLIEMKVSIYTLLGFNKLGYSIYSLMNNIPREDQDTLARRYIEEYVEYKMRLENSKVAKVFLERAINKIKEI